MAIKQVLIALDQLANTLIDNGMSDETISARAYRLTDNSRAWHKAHIAIDYVFRVLFGELNHCYLSYVSEWQRNQLPKEYQHCRSYAAFF